MDAQQLAVLREVAEQGSITGAAQVLHCTPSAVSQQVKALEARAGTPLVERVGRGIRITPAGQELARSAVDVALALERAAAACARFAHRPTGTVRVAAFQSGGKMFLPRLLAAVAADEGVAVECGEEDVTQPAFVPLTGEYDIVIGHRPDRGYEWGGAPSAHGWINHVNVLGSDALLDNSLGRQAHRALGFEERERVIYFRKRL